MGSVVRVHAHVADLLMFGYHLGRFMKTPIGSDRFPRGSSWVIYDSSYGDAAGVSSSNVAIASATSLSTVAVHASRIHWCRWGEEPLTIPLKRVISVSAAPSPAPMAACNSLGTFSGMIVRGG